MSTTWTIEVPVHFQRCGHGSRKEMKSGTIAAIETQLGLT